MKVRIVWNEHAIAIRKEMEHGKGYLTLMNFLDELERFSEVVLTRKRWRTLYSQQFFHEYLVQGFYVSVVDEGLQVV